MREKDSFTQLEWEACVRVLRVLSRDPFLARDVRTFKGLVKRAHRNVQRVRRKVPDELLDLIDIPPQLFQKTTDAHYSDAEWDACLRALRPLSRDPLSAPEPYMFCSLIRQIYRTARKRLRRDARRMRRKTRRAVEATAPSVITIHDVHFIGDVSTPQVMRPLGPQLRQRMHRTVYAERPSFWRRALDWLMDQD